MAEVEIIEPKQEDALIAVTQLPVIVQQLRTVKEKFTLMARETKALEVSEDTLQVAKKHRAEMTKVFNDLESRRKAVKKQILTPYEEFEKIYRECVTEIYKPCDEALAGKISEIENGLKKKKQDELEAYFNELCASKGIDFLKLSDSGVTVNLSTSMKKLRDTVSNFVDGVWEDLSLISTLVDYSEETLVEYKQSLNLAKAMKTVTERHEAIKQEQERAEAAKRWTAEIEAAEARADEAVREYAPPVIEQEEEEPDVSPAENAEKIYRVTFTVNASLEKIKALKEFLVKGNYDYE